MGNGRNFDVENLDSICQTCRIEKQYCDVDNIINCRQLLLIALLQLDDQKDNLNPMY